MTFEGAAEVFEHGQSVFAQRADIGADSHVSSGAFQGAKAARDFEARLHESEITLGLVMPPAGLCRVLPWRGAAG